MAKITENTPEPARTYTLEVSRPELEAIQYALRHDRIHDPAHPSVQIYMAIERLLGS